MTAYRGAEGPELGPLVEDVRPNRGPLTALLVLFLFIAFIIDVSAIVSRPANFERWLTVLLFGIVIPVLVLIARFGRQPDPIRIHQDGFVSEPRAHAVRWDDVVELRTKRHVSGRRTQLRSALDIHTLRTKSGETIELRFGFTDNDAVLRQLHERTRDHLLATTTLPATFGVIKVDDAGVRTDVTTLGWAQVTRAALEGPDSRVVIRGPGSAWIEAPLHEVPNAHVLVALVNKRASAA